MARIIVLIALFFILQGCSTKYQEVGFKGGYSEMQLDENIFKVSFKGNGYTKREKVADFTLLRSAELTLDNGYSYFSVIDANSYSTNSTYTTPATSSSTGSVYVSDNKIYGHSTTITTKGQTYNISKPRSTNTIVCFKEKHTSGFSYNAKFVLKSIREKYSIKDKK